MDTPTYDLTLTTAEMLQLQELLWAQGEVIDNDPERRNFSGKTILGDILEKVWAVSNSSTDRQEATWAHMSGN
jgi:hypothetical protein